jgi:hypothetical protein
MELELLPRSKHVRRLLAVGIVVLFVLICTYTMIPELVALYKSSWKFKKLKFVI